MSNSRPAGDSKMMGLSALSISSILGALLAYVRFAQITSIFGANWRTDALAVAMVFPFLVREVVAHSFGSAFIPIYSRVMEQKGHSAAVAFVGRVISWIVLISVVLIAILWFTSNSLVKIISPNGSPELLQLASVLLRIFLPMIILATVNGILANFIKYEKRFIVLAVSGVIGLAVSLTVLLFVGNSMGIQIIPISTLTGGVFGFLFLLYQSTKSGFVMRATLHKDAFLVQLTRMAGPVVGGTLVGFFAPIADKMLASFLPESSVTAIDYANRIKNIALAVVFQPFLTFADLSFSIEAARGQKEQLLLVLRKNINTTSMVMLPTSVLLTILAVPVVSVFFQRGNFSSADSEYIGYALAFYAPWLAQFGIGSLISRVFYAQKDSATPVTIGIFAAITNVLLNLILVGPLGIGGLALATTVTSTAKTIYLTWSLSRKMGGLHLQKILPEQIRIFVANLTLAGITIILLKFWSFDTQASFLIRFMQLTIYTFSGVTAMIIMLFVLKSTTAKNATDRILPKIRNRIFR